MWLEAFYPKKIIFQGNVQFGQKVTFEPFIEFILKP